MKARSDTPSRLPNKEVWVVAFVLANAIQSGSTFSFNLGGNINAHYELGSNYHTDIPVSLELSC